MSKKNNETTSPRVATIAAKLLADPKSSKDVKAVAAAALTQAADKKPPVKKAPVKKTTPKKK